MNLLKSIARFAFMILLVVHFSAVSKNVDNSKYQEILMESDKARGTIEQGVSWQATLESTDEDLETSIFKFKIEALKENIRIEVIKPEKNKGNIYLYNGPLLWYFQENLRKAVSLSVRQRLSGLTSYGDIANTYYSHYYDIKEVNEEVINGKNNYVFLLKAKKNNTAYDLIKYWVDEKEKLGIKADFLALNGNIIKSAIFSYGNVFNLDGNKINFISKMIITVKNQPNEKAIISYDNIKNENYNQSYFSVSNLKK